MLISSALNTSTGTGELDTDLGLPRVPMLTTSSTYSLSCANEPTESIVLTAMIVVKDSLEAAQIALFNIIISLRIDIKLESSAFIHQFLCFCELKRDFFSKNLIAIGFVTPYETNFKLVIHHDLN